MTDQEMAAARARWADTMADLAGQLSDCRAELEATLRQGLKAERVYQVKIEQLRAEVERLQERERMRAYIQTRHDSL